MARRHRNPGEFRREHMYLDADGSLRAKPRLTEAAARAAAWQVFDLTGRSWVAYRCRLPECGAWHIRACRRRPADLAVSA